MLLHCGAGMSRSVAIASLYLHVVGYANYGEALAAIARFREVDVSPAMQRSVEKYLQNLARGGQIKAVILDSQAGKYTRRVAPLVNARQCLPVLFLCAIT